MSKHEEVNLFELLRLCWLGKLWITIFILVFLAAGYFYDVQRHKKYVSEIGMLFAAQDTPIEAAVVFMKFEEYFFDFQTFKDWQTLNTQKPLSFDNIKRDRDINGSIFLLEPKSRQVYFGPVINASSSGAIANVITFVESKDYEVVDAVHSYLSFVNKKLMDKYLLDAQAELAKLKALAANKDEKMAFFAINAYKLEKFISSFENNGAFIKIKHPTLPKIKVMSSVFVVCTFGLLGGVWGVCFVLFRNIRQKRFLEDSV